MTPSRSAVVFALLLLSLLPACNLYENRASALSVTLALKQASIDRETQSLQLARGLIEAHLKEVRARVRTEFERGVAELRIRFHERIEQKRIELSGMVKTDVATALDPVLSQLNTDLAAAKQVQGDGAPRLREYTLAAQQASTMAVASHEVFKILEEVDAQLRKLRKELDDELTQQAGTATVVPDLDNQMQALVTQLEQQSQQYQAQIDGAHQQLQRYFDTSSAPGLFFSGVAKGIGWNADGLAGMADQVLDKGRNAITKWIGDQTTKLESKLTASAGLLEAAAAKVGTNK